MNIIFADKLSDTLFTEELRHDAGGYLPHWLLTRMQGAYCMRHTDHPQDVPPWELYKSQHGQMPVLVIAANTRDVERHNDILRTHYFDWAVYGLPVDNYGQVQGDPLGQCVNSNRIVNGGLVNHGSLDQPKWSSHT